MSEYYAPVLLVSLGVVFYALLSRRLADSVLTLPMVFVGFGFALGDGGLGMVRLQSGAVLQVFAEITLVLVLFTDAAGVRVAQLRHTLSVPVRMLLIGMPLTILFGTALVHWVMPELSLAMALLLAAMLTPTDAALAQSLLESHSVPPDMRESINVESGLNDGLSVPVIIGAATLAAADSFAAVDHEMSQSLLGSALAQLTLGPLVGLAAGFVLARLLDVSIARNLVSDTGRGIAVLAAALATFVASELLGGNGFIAVFIAGLVLGNCLHAHSKFIFEFMEGEGQVLSMLTFLVFGAVLLPLALEQANWQMWVIALSFLSVIRMLPIWFSLLGLGLSTGRKLSLGWFGPRGLASILFALLVGEQFTLPAYQQVLACVALTVGISVVLHGVSAAPLVLRSGFRAT